MTDVKESSHSTDNPLVFRPTPRSLQSMTGLELALLCWQHEMSNLYPDEMDCLRDFWFHCHKLTSGDIFHASNRIVELIDHHIEQFAEALQNWMVAYLPMCTYNDGDFKTEEVLKVLKNIIIEPCGNIIDVKTARKLVSGDMFDPLDRFKLACEYSLVADIQRLWPSVSDNLAIRDYTLNHRHSKHYYWRCRMRNELNKIPGNEQNSPEFRLMSRNYGICDSWSDVEFFWDKLKPQEQILEMTLACFLGRQTSHHVLSKLNRTQLGYVLTFTRMPDKIMINLSRYDYTFEYALKTWSFMKNLVTGEQFFNILYGLWGKAYCFTPDRFEGGRADVLLYEIWSVAPAVLKNYVLDNHVEKFFNNLWKKPYSMENYGCDLRFLRCLLTGTKFELRNELWRRNWRKFIMLATPDDFDKFLRLCFENEIDIAEFKNNDMLNFEQLPGYFEEFIKAGFTRELINYFRFFSSDENRITLLKKFINEWFLSKAHAYACSVSNSVITSMVNFIDSNIAIDVSPAFISVDQFKEFFTRFNNTSSLIFSAEDFKEFFIRYNLNKFFHMIDQSNFTSPKDIIDSVLPSDNKYLIEIKQLLYKHCLHSLGSADCKLWCMRDWNEFLEWCVPSQQEFRKALPVDHIFEQLLISVICEIPRSSEVESDYDDYDELCYYRYANQIKHRYRSLNNFLRWYFEDDATKRNKLCKINSYCDPDAIVKMLREGNASIIVSDIVNWFFDEDVEKIAKFRARVIDK